VRVDDEGAVWAVSDVHGHLDDLSEGLSRAGLVDDADRWCGGSAQLWVLGDMLDRGPDGLGVVRYLRRLEEQAPDRLHVLLGNHEVLTLAMWLFPGGAFDPVWRHNGGQVADQVGLTTDDVAWLRSLPAMGRAGDLLLAHSDTTAYLRWGSTVDEVNAKVSELLQGDEEAHREAWRVLIGRWEFVRLGGTERVRELLDTLGGKRFVHGHSIVADLPGAGGVTGPLLYADGLALAIDGGRYDGGPLLVVRLDQDDAGS